MADMLRFRAVADADVWAVAFRLVLCGLRRSEVCGLRWSSVDTESGTVRVEASRVKVGPGGQTVTDEPKSAASARNVPVETMHTGTTGMLRRLSAQQRADRLAAGPAWTNSGLVIADPLGEGIHPDALTARWLRLCRAAEVPIIGMHSVRHTLATTLHPAGEAPADVAALLGHSVLVHTSFYVTRAERGAVRAAGALGEVLSAPSRGQSACVL